MSQGTLQVANQGFPGIRTDLNAALAALNSKNSGSAAPSALAAGQSWLDTSNGTRPALMQYDGAQWLEVERFDTNANRSYKGTGYFGSGGTGAPSIAFENDPDTGWYSRGTNGAAMSMNGVDAHLITAGGQHSFPLQAAFGAPTAPQINATGDGTVVDITAGTALWNVGAGLNTSTGVFTAPVSGVYLFTINLIAQELSAAMTTCQLELVTSNKTFAPLYTNGANFRANDNQGNITCALEAYLDAADTAKWRLTIFGGSKVVDITSNGQISGRLLA